MRERGREKVSNVLKKLEDRGYFARGPWWCCSSCGWVAVPDDQREKVVFWNEQTDETAFDEVGDLLGKLFLQWAGDGDEIVKAFEEDGFETEWDGTENMTVIVHDPEYYDPDFCGREESCPECGELESECICDSLCDDCGEHWMDCVCEEDDEDDEEKAETE